MPTEVDDDDQWLLRDYAWSINAQGYVVTNLPDDLYRQMTNIRLHHCIVGYPLDGYVVDHIDRNPQNNRRSNLRYVTRSQNATNSTRSDRARYIRVTYAGKYEVRITRDGVVHHIGTFADEHDAIAARNSALISLGEQPK